MLMRYLAKLDDSSQKFFDKRLAAMSWARREAARWCKVYLLGGKCPLVAHYQRDDLHPLRYIPLPVVGLSDCLHPEREDYDNLNCRRMAMIELFRPPGMLTVGEMLTLHKCERTYLWRLTQSGKLTYVMVRNTRFYHKDQLVPMPPPLHNKRQTGAWALHWDQCQDCGTSSRNKGHQHAAHGLCKNCREKRRRLAKKEAAR